MILPTKYVPLQNSLLGVGSVILKKLNSPQTISSLWMRVKHVPSVGNFERFTLVLDMLFMLGMVKFERGMLFKSHD